MHVARLLRFVNQKHLEEKAALMHARAFINRNV